jgi:hypothetical protein
VARKFVFLAQQERLKQAEFLKRYLGKKVVYVQFDEMESSIHTKCKPVSIIIAIEPEKRKILGYMVAQMPAKGPLAEISRKKYGIREDHRPQAMDKLFTQLQPYIHPEADLKSDQNPRYPNPVKKHFPQACHITVKGRRGCIVGQGELKKIGFDPLFSLNHTCAMLRANLNRLVRKTWCTTKKIERLDDHLALYVSYHNLVLTE